MNTRITNAVLVNIDEENMLDICTALKINYTLKLGWYLILDIEKKGLFFTKRYKALQILDEQ